MGIGYCLAGIIGALMVAGTAYGAEFTAHPLLAVAEEFTDNVFETSTGRSSDFITRARPGITLAARSAALEADLKYLFDYRYYARRTRSADTTHDLAAHGTLTVVPNLLFLEVDDQYRRVSLDVTRDVSRESLFLNQEDRNVLRVSPYLTLHPGQKTTVKTGYRFVDTRYLDSSLGIDKTEHSAFIEGSHEICSTWFATGGYLYTHQENEIASLNQQQPYAGFRYEYAEKSYLFGQVGYTWIRYSNGGGLNNIYWNAGASHSFRGGNIALSTGIRYDEDPLNDIRQEMFVAGKIEKALKSGSLALSLYYSEFVLPATDVLQTRKYGSILGGRYDFTSRLNGTVAFTAEKFDTRLPRTYTRLLLADTGLGYHLGEQLTVSLKYIFVDYHSPGIATDNRQVNRAVLEVVKVL